MTAVNPFYCVLPLPEGRALDQVNYLKGQTDNPDPAEAHVTLRYAKEMHRDMAPYILRRLEMIGKQHTPITLQLREIGRFDSGVTFVLLEESERLRSLQAAVDRVIQAMGLGASDFDLWVPHVTISYYEYWVDEPEHETFVVDHIKASTTEINNIVIPLVGDR